MLSLKQHTISQEHLDKMIWQDEAKIPVEEGHEMPLSLNNVIVRGHHVSLSELSTKPVVIPLNIIDENQLVIYFIILGRDQEAGRHKYRQYPRCHWLYILIRLTPLVQEKSVKKLNGNMKGFDALVELLAHKEYSLDQWCPLFDVDSSDFVFTIGQILQGDKMVELVSGLILKHLCQELRRRNVSVEFFIFVFDGGAQILYGKNIL